MEIFRDIEGYEDRYQISNQGRVWSKSRRKVMSVGKHKSNSGYVQVQLYKDGEYHWKYIHKMVAKAFVDNPNNYRTINHKDGVKTNNAANNLEWASDEQQQRHAYMMGLKSGGIAMSDKEVFKVYDMFFKENKTPRKISEILKKPFGTIKKICYGERLRDLLRKYREKVILQKE